MSRNVSVNSEPKKTVRTCRSASMFSIRTNRVNFEVPVKVPRRLSSSRPRWGACVRLGKPGHSGTGKGI
jgi:hypothetical protein